MVSEGCLGSFASESTLTDSFAASNAFWVLWLRPTCTLNCKAYSISLDLDRTFSSGKDACGNDVG